MTAPDMTRPYAVATFAGVRRFATLARAIRFAESETVRTRCGHTVARIRPDGGTDELGASGAWHPVR